MTPITISVLGSLASTLAATYEGYVPRVVVEPPRRPSRVNGAPVVGREF